MDEEDEGFRAHVPSVTPSRGPNRPLLTFAKDNVALLIPIIGVLIFALRCVAVSGGSTQVAFAL